MVTKTKEENEVVCASDAEDIELVNRAKSGDGTAVNEIIEKYKPMLIAKSKNYFLAGADKDDLIQEGMIGLYKAIRDFEEDKINSFRGFADLCVTRQILTAVKAATRNKHIPLNSYISLNKPVFENESEQTLFDVFTNNADANPERLLILKENHRIIEDKAKSILSSFEQEVFEYYVNGLSYREISKILNKEPKSVDNAIQRIKRKLEKSLENKGD